MSKRTRTTEQTAASEHEHSCWLEAHAGAGKTTVLIDRILSILTRGGSDIRRVMCLTYTNSAAQEMYTRLVSILSEWARLYKMGQHDTLRTMLGNVSEEQLAMLGCFLFRVFDEQGVSSFKTIHSFCHYLLQSFPIEFGISVGCIVLDPYQDQCLYQEYLGALFRQNPEDLAAHGIDMKQLAMHGIAHFHDLLKKLPWGPLSDSYDVQDEDKMDFLKRLNIVVLSGYASYRKSLGVLNYDDQINYVHRLFRTPSHQDQWVKYNIFSKLRHIMLDEAQDTDKKQWDILSAIWEEYVHQQGRSVLVVGDTKQRIYGFRGVDQTIFPAYKKRFLKQFGTQSSRQLSWTFRSDKNILKFVNQMCQHDLFKNSLSVSASHKGNSSKMGCVELWEIPAERPSKPKGTTTHIQRLMTDERIITGGLTALAWSIADKIKHVLSSGQYTGANIAVLLRAIKPWVSSVFLQELKKRLAYVPVAISIAIEQDGALGKNPIAQEILHVFKAALSRSNLAIATLLRGVFFRLTQGELDDIIIGMKSANERCLFDYLRVVRPEIYEFVKRIEVMLRDHGPLCFFNYILGYDYRQQLKQFFPSQQTDDISDQILSIAPAHNTRDMLSYLERAGVHTTSSGEFVRVMTIHRAKGMEFPVVFLPILQETGDQSDDLTTFYVAITRACRQLYIAYPSYLGHDALLCAVRGVMVQCGASEHETAQNESYNTAATDATAPTPPLNNADDATDAATTPPLNSADDATDAAPTPPLNNADDATDAATTPPLNATQKESCLQKQIKLYYKQWKLSGEIDAHIKPVTVLLQPDKFEPLYLWEQTISDNTTLPRQLKVAKNQQQSRAIFMGTVLHDLLDRLLLYDRADMRMQATEYLMTRYGLGQQACAGLTDQAIAIVLKYPHFFAPHNTYSELEIVVASEANNSTKEVRRIDRVIFDDANKKITLLEYKTDNHPINDLHSLDARRPEYVQQIQHYHDLVCKTYPTWHVESYLLWTKTLELLCVC